MGFLLMITLTFDVFLGFLMLRKVEKCTKLALEIGKSRGSLMMVKLSTRHTQQHGQHSMAQVYGMLHKVSPSNMLTNTNQSNEVVLFLSIQTVLCLQGVDS